MKNARLGLLLNMSIGNWRLLTQEQSPDPATNFALMESFIKDWEPRATPELVQRYEAMLESMRAFLKEVDDIRLITTRERIVTDLRAALVSAGINPDNPIRQPPAGRSIIFETIPGGEEFKTLLMHRMKPRDADKELRVRSAFGTLLHCESVVELDDLLGKPVNISYPTLGGDYDGNTMVTKPKRANQSAKAREASRRRGHNPDTCESNKKAQWKSDNYAPGRRR